MYRSRRVKRVINILLVLKTTYTERLREASTTSRTFSYFCVWLNRSPFCATLFHLPLPETPGYKRYSKRNFFKNFISSVGKISICTGITVRNFETVYDKPNHESFEISLSFRDGVSQSSVCDGTNYANSPERKSIVLGTVKFRGTVNRRARLTSGSVHFAR